MDFHGAAIHSADGRTLAGGLLQPCRGGAQKEKYDDGAGNNQQNPLH